MTRSLAIDRQHCYQRMTPSREDTRQRMNYFAHTAEDDQGKRLVDESRWQLLRDHLRSVSRLAKECARPLGLEQEAELAGLLHDLGKYTNGSPLSLVQVRITQ